MAEIAALLGTLSILLTFAAGYRITGFVSDGSPMFTLIVAFGMTLSYMLLFEFVLVVFGIATLLAPTGFIYHRRGRVPILSDLINWMRRKFQRVTGRESQVCEDCETVNVPSNDYCKNCGRKLSGGKS